MTTIVLIGSGNVATHLFKVFSASESIKIIQVVGRNERTLERFEGAEAMSTDFNGIKDADIYIIAVSDDSILSVSQHLSDKNGLIVHTSGSKTIDELSSHARRGVFYPLQTFSHFREIDFKKVPICLEARQESDFNLLQNLASQISDKVYEVSSDQRRSLHLSAVFVNNFTNHLIHIGNRICLENSLPFEMLQPLLQETVSKLNEISPYDSQTGPARRGDLKTMQNQMDQLKNRDDQEIYRVLSRSIQKTYGKKL